MCLRATQGDDTTPARTLRARALLRLRRPDEAGAALRGVWLENDVARGEVAMLRSAAAARVGDYAVAERLLLTARAYVFSTDAPALEAELEYHSALTAFGRADLQAAAAACRRLLQVSPREGLNEYVVPLRHMRANAFELLGFLRAARGNYAAQVPLAFKALDEYRRSRVRDDFEEAHHVAGAAVLAKDFDLVEHTAALRSHVEEVRWAHSTAEPRFRAYEALGWAAALHGDFVAAFRCFRRTGDALSIAQEIWVGADRALLAYELDQRIVAAEELGHALDLAERFDWRRADGEERLTLVRLAQAAARPEPTRARAALDLYGRTRTEPSSCGAAPIGERALAEEAFAEGVIARAEGNVTLALDHLRRAFEFWSVAGYAWRAARAAIELVEMGTGGPYSEYLAHELTLRASSWMAKRAAASLTLA